MSFFDELRRRNVIRVAAGYIVAAWLVVQVVETIFPAFGFGDEAVRFVVIGFAVAFIPVVVLAWVFEWTPQGIRKDGGNVAKGPANLAMARRWDRVVMVILALAVAFFIVDKFLDQPIDIKPAIVVLPFEGGELPPGSEHLPATLAEGVYTSLARIPQLAVSAWPTVNRLAVEGLDNEDIVRTLKAANALYGTIEAVGDHVEVTAWVVATEPHAKVWEEAFRGTAKDLFDIHADIVAAVAERLHLGSTGVLYRARPADPDAQRLTLQAWSILTRVNMPHNGTVAAELLRQALSIDPDYVPALNLSSFAAYLQEQEGAIEPGVADAINNDVKERVAAIDYEDGLQNAYLAWELFWDDHEPAHSNQHLQVALRTGLNDGEALRMLAGFARRTGNFDAAIWFGDRAVAIDPTCENCVWQTTENLFYARRFAEAIEAKKHFQAFGSGGFGNHAFMLLSMGEPEAALELITSRESYDPGNWLSLRAMACHALDDSKCFAADIARLEQLQRWSDLAEVYSFMGEIDLAFAALDKSVAQGQRLAGQLFLPHWDNLRNDPRWTALRDELGMSDASVSILDFSPVLRYEQ